MLYHAGIKSDSATAEDSAIRLPKLGFRHCIGVPQPGIPQLSGFQNWEFAPVWIPQLSGFCNSSSSNHRPQASKKMQKRAGSVGGGGRLPALKLQTRPQPQADSGPKHPSDSKRKPRAWMPQLGFRHRWDSATLLTPQLFGLRNWDSSSNHRPEASGWDSQF